MFTLSTHKPDILIHSNPILMVPGSFCSAKIWQTGYVDFFRLRGYQVHTLTFSGHGRPRVPRLRCGLQWYLNDLRRAVDHLDDTPFIIAHSLGAFITLRLLCERSVPGAALLSPIPISGMGDILLNLLKASPVDAMKWLGLLLEPGVRHLGKPPKGIYSDQVDAQLEKTITAQLAPESIKALIEVLPKQNIDLLRIDSPVHFFAATGDHVIPYHLVESMAKSISAPVITYEGMSHTFQAESNWQRVAEDIAEWFSFQQLPKQSAKAMEIALCH